MKRVLFITYNFPPLAGGGTFRSLKFVKYLPEFGWLPTVITTNTKNYWAYDRTLLDEIPKKVKIIRAAEFDPFYLHILLSKIGLGKLYQKIKDLFFIPDEKIGWIPFAYFKAVKELKTRKYDLIFSTSPTPCAHIIALKLKKRYGIPWIADYRDHWTLNPEYPYREKGYRSKFEFHIEKIINQYARRIITVTEGNFHEMQTKFQIQSNRLKLIYNGYDSNKTQKQYVINLSERKLKFLYTGTFYGDRNPDLLLKSVAILHKEIPDIIERIQITFIGKTDYNISEHANKYGINQCISHISSMPRSLIDEEYQNCHCLLLIIPSSQNHVLTSKIFDYMATNKPIFAIIPDGEAKSILQTSKLGFFTDPGSVDSIKNELLRIFNLWKSNKLQVKPNIKYIQQFHRRNLTKQLVSVFNSVVD